MTTVIPPYGDRTAVGLVESPADADWSAAPADAAPPGDPAPPGRGRLARFVRGRESDAAWVRPALLTLLVLTAVLYLWDLGASGWANSFYSAAVQAGTKSWKAFFFGSSDSSNFITVDKPPASLWVMEISARIFGVNSWSILVPQALEGVATVGLVYLTVRRWFTAQAALLAGVVLALTPVAAMMFRFNNPDALLALLLTGSMYAMTRALEKAQTKWLVLAGTLIGFGFLTKMLQAFLIIPALVIVYLLAAPTGWWRRVWQVVVLGVATAGVRRLVGRRRGAHPRSRPSLCRGFPEQQHPQPDLRLQRLRSSHRERVRQRRRGWRGRVGGPVGPYRAHPPVQPPVRQHDVVAAPRCSAHGRRTPGLHRPGPPDRP